MSGRLELNVKFSELPRPFPVQDGLKIGIQTGERIVTAILPAKVWRKLEQAARDYPQWVAVLSGALDRFADGEIALKRPILQVFEKKIKPEAAPAAKASEPKAPEPKASDLQASDANVPAATAPETKVLEPNPPAPESPVVKASVVKATDRKTPDASPPASPYTKLSLKGRGTTQGG